MSNHAAADCHDADWPRLDHFLACGGSDDDGVVELVRRCVVTDGARLVSRIVAISVAGRVPKNDPAIFSLAIAAKLGDDATRRAAYAAVPQVCGSPTDLMRFAAHAQRFGGWGRGMRKAVGAWFNAQPASELARQLVQCPAYPGWSTRDLLRLAHPRAASPAHDHLFAWIATGVLTAAARSEPALALLVAIEQLTATADVSTAARIIREHRVPRTCVPAELLAVPAISEALLDDSFAPCS